MTEDEVAQRRGVAPSAAPEVDAEPDVEIRILGPLEVVVATGDEVEIASAPQRRLLSVLALHVGARIRHSALEEWLRLTPGALRTSICRLRRVIGLKALETTAQGYRLRADVDATAFEELVALAPNVDDANARGALERAILLWRDDPLLEFTDEPWAEPEIGRLAEEHATAVEDLAVLQLDAGEMSAALLSLRELIELHPYRDRPRALLMRALEEAGRRTEALRAFEDYRCMLHDDVGTEPSAPLIELDRAVVASADRGVPLGAWPGHPAWTRTRHDAAAGG